MFKSPIFDFLGSKLVLNNNYNSSSNTIFVMSGYGSDNYVNNSYLLLAKKLTKLLRENNQSNYQLIITGRFQVYPEAQIIKKLLITTGMDNQNIITIDSEYKNTYENLSLFFKLIEEKSFKKNIEITLLTSPYHSKRVSLIIKKKLSNYNINIITSDKLDMKQLSKIKVISYEYLSIIYNYFKGNI